MTVSREPGSGGLTALVVAGTLVLGVSVGTWSGASAATMAAGGKVQGGLGDWLKVTARLAMGDVPSEAWAEHGTDVPDGMLYWVATSLAFACLAAAGIVVWRLWRSVSGNGGRRRFGQSTEARQATENDVAPLRVKALSPPTGRMLLGRLQGTKTLLATEDRERHPLKGSVARRQGNRGSVALIGPTGSGKTALVSSAIATWDGPVVSVSVKRDLYDTTAAARAQRGEIAVFDPGAATGLSSARWSPLESVTTASAALRTGRALAQAIPRSGVSNADYWAKHGEKLLGAIVGVAALSRLVECEEPLTPRPLGMEQMATWVSTMADGRDETISSLLRTGLQADQPEEVQLIARQSAVTFIGIGKEDHRIKSSIYATAALALEPWLEPAVAHSSSDDRRTLYSAGDKWPRKPRLIDLEWLMGGGEGQANTLYLTASQPEYERLSPVLGGLLASLKDEIHDWDIAGRTLDKPLMIVIDEAGQLELGWLPAEVSTIAALGAFFVTCWQSKAQIDHRYNSLADAVMSGHRSKCVFAGVDDPATIRWLRDLLGYEEVGRRSWSSDVPSLLGGGQGRRSVSESQQREEFAPASTLRQMFPGEAVLLHGTLPPVHLDAVRWWREKSLAALVPTDETGRATPPDDLATCPLVSRDSADVNEDEPVRDRSSFEQALAGLTTRKQSESSNGQRSTNERNGDGERTRSRKPRTPPAARSRSGTRGRSTGGEATVGGGVQLTLDATPNPTTAVDGTAEASRSDEPAPVITHAEVAEEQFERARVRTHCDWCGAVIPPGQGRRYDRASRRSVVVCWPHCDTTDPSPTR